MTLPKKKSNDKMGTQIELWPAAPCGAQLGKRRPAFTSEKVLMLGVSCLILRRLMMGFINQLLGMTFGGILIAVGVLLFVLLLGYAELIKTGGQKIVATLITALILSGVWSVVQGNEVELLALIYQAFIGASVASLVYVKLVKSRIKPVESDLEELA